MDLSEQPLCKLKTLGHKIIIFGTQHGVKVTKWVKQIRIIFGYCQCVVKPM